MSLKKISPVSVVGTRGYFNENKRLDMYFVHPEKIEALEHLNRVANSRNFDTVGLEEVLKLPVEKGSGIKEDVGDNYAIVPGCLTSDFLVDLQKASRSPNYPSRKQLQNEDILLLADAHSEGYIGKNNSMVILRSDEKAVYIGHLIRLRPDQCKIDSFYLLAYMNFPDIRLLLQYSVRGQTVGLYPNDIRNLPIILPQRGIQISIGDKLKQSIEKKTEAEKKKKEIDEVFNKYLPMDFEMPSNVSYTYDKKESHIINRRLDPHFYHPKYRYVTKLINQAEVQKRNLEDLVSFSKSTFNPEKLGEQKFKYVEIDNINLAYGYIESHSEMVGKKAPSRARKLLKESDLLIPLTRPYRGAVAVVDAFYNDCIGTTGFSVSQSKLKDVDTYYICAFLKTKFGIMQLGQRMSNANYPAVIESNLRDILVPILPNSERLKISSYMESILSFSRESQSLHQQAMSELGGLLSFNEVES